MMVLAASAVVVVLVGLCLTYVFWSRTGSTVECSNCAGRGGFWQDTDECSVCHGTGVQPSIQTSVLAASPLELYADIKREVNIASSAMWNDRAEAAQLTGAPSAAEKIQLGASNPHV